MDLRQYVAILHRGFGIIFGITVIFTLVVSGVVFFSPAKYDATTSITVDRPSAVDQKNANYYLFDNYYSQQSSGLLADTIINWMQSPSVVESIYTRAQISLPEVRKVSALGKIFSVRKLPPATVNVTYRDQDQQKAKLLLQSTITELQNRASDLSRSASGDQIGLHATGVVSAIVKPFWTLDLVISILTGFLLGLLVVLVRENLRPSK